jgi:cytochrome c556
VGASNADEAKANTVILKKAFAEVETFWKARGKADATGWAGDARKHAESVERSAGLGNWDAVNSSTATLGQSCQSCHTAYRERLEDGSFRFKR